MTAGFGIPDATNKTLLPHILTSCFRLSLIPLYSTYGLFADNADRPHTAPNLHFDLESALLDKEIFCPDTPLKRNKQTTKE